MTPHHDSAACKTDIDWSAKPEPWNKIGPALRQECEAIVHGDAPPAVAPRFMAPAPSGASLRGRRKVLGLQAKYVASMLETTNGAVSAAEVHNANPGIRRRIDALLSRIEAERQQKDAA